MREGSARFASRFGPEKEVKKQITRSPPLFLLEETWLGPLLVHVTAPLLPQSSLMSLYSPPFCCLESEKLGREEKKAREEIEEL